MKTHNFFTKAPLMLAIFSMGMFAACSSDDDTPTPTPADPDPDPTEDPVTDPELMSETFEYSFNEGQLLGDPATAYDGSKGDHPRNLSATMLVEELEDGNARVTLTLNNTIDGETYAVHAHDAADPNETENGTPYNETPNSGVFAGMLTASGNSAMESVETDITYEELINTYEGFLVVHDPTQELSTVDLTTYLVLGTFARENEAGEANLRTASFEYTFNEGQAAGDGTAYEGEHARDLMATLTIEEQIDGTSVVTIMLNNTVDGEEYAVHAHDFADASETPNGTPYNETPNGDVFAGMIMSADGSGMASNNSPMSFNELTQNYEAFLVVHDPLQELSTVDLTTYLVLGVFADGGEESNDGE